MDTAVAAPNVRVAVCILTRKREAGLTRVVEGLSAQLIPSGHNLELRIVVVDNDPQGTALPVCDRLRPTCRWPIDYVLEPIEGIPQARNRAIDTAVGASDLMAFLDDDEVPSDTWLAELLRVWKAYSADVVFGPVTPHFPERVPRWIERGRFFDREEFLTGTVRPVGWTNNVIMSTRMLVESGIRFDEALRFSGGSDNAFFRRINGAGYRMVWADEALAVEWIPRSRATLEWLAKRHFRNGALNGRQRSLAKRLRATVIGIARIGVGAGCAVVFLPFGRHRFAKAVRWASYGMGLVYGAAGKHYHEYRDVRSV